jgi:hypothetical protein
MLQRIIEGVLSPLPLRTLDRRLERYWKAVWVRRYAHMDREGIDRAFTSTASISRAYAGDFQAGILDAYRKRMAAYGLA